MKQGTIHQTVFQVEPLKNIVGIGNTTAFQIIISRGRTLGTMGVITVPAFADVRNESDFARSIAGESAGGPLTSWFRRALATLNS